MTYIAPLKEDWLRQLSDVITDPFKLLQILKLEKDPFLCRVVAASHLFPFLVPRAFVSRMKPGDPNDPLLRQVITTNEEFNLIHGFSVNPLNEHSVIPGVLHKYKNRALILVKKSCAIHCRYCFRRFFSYKKNQGSKKNWMRITTYFQEHPELNEIILSGGDPLMALDDELGQLISLLEKIPHITTIRIHSRLPVIVPARITTRLCQILAFCRMNVVLVTHVNHAHEIDFDFYKSMAKLRNAGVTLLNQSVLLRGINDNANILAELSRTLFNAGVLPYYLHLLDRVHGTSHFLVEDKQAKKIMRQLLEKTSGYLVPRLSREIAGKRSKVLLSFGTRLK
ncbi:EF-P beta-lysylation protein EpmB [Sodalis sp. CWE]|uniref:EF-P beta-lysylation protein EpmB n=1 Tax=Sodalis sp. CWE TaxID=2803816 RepID=UPI001C7D5DF9|nr:EF-P beta-lysylation protein EpmB [Sodalis sp. CWE]MBX4180816.1 EF-P beta-lysylation protein EpmB [Sodalis sp. CWE]